MATTITELRKLQKEYKRLGLSKEYWEIENKIYWIKTNKKQNEINKA